MTILKVEGMHCTHCVDRITKALTQAELDFTVSLQDKTVSINGCENCVKKAMEELSDLGFEAEIQ